MLARTTRGICLGLPARRTRWGPAKGNQYRGAAASDGEKWAVAPLSPVPRRGAYQEAGKGFDAPGGNRGARKFKDMTKKCVVEGCGKPSGVRGTARGLCSMHYSRHLRNGDPSIRSQHVYLTHQTCSVKDCDRLVVGRGLCSMHWATPEAPR